MNRAALGSLLLAVAVAGCASKDKDAASQLPVLVPNVSELECRSGGDMQLYISGSSSVGGQGATNAFPRGLVEARLWVEPVEGRETKLKPGQCKLLDDDELLFPRLFNLAGNRSMDGKMRLNLRVDPFELTNGGESAGEAKVQISFRHDDTVTALSGLPALFDQVRAMVEKPDTYRLPIDYNNPERLLIGPPREAD